MNDSLMNEILSILDEDGKLSPPIYENGCRAECDRAYGDLRIPLSEIEEAEWERERIANSTFDIVFANMDHGKYEPEIRDFCAWNAHPSQLFFLHLPVQDDLTLDCAWDENRNLMIVTLTEKDEQITLKRQPLH